MKEGIHPDYHDITYKRTDGSEFKTKSCWGKPGAVLQLDVDILTHSLWVGGKTKVNDRTGNVAKFNKKFGGLSIASMSDKIGKPSVSANTAPKKDAKKDAKKK
jgi:large subunit ribosomal protein L31